MTASTSKYYHELVSKPIAIAPLITFRILFGLLMCFGAVRFIANGWITTLFVEPKFFFKFYGFHWVQTPGELGMYFLFCLIVLSSLCIALGYLYRWASITFFLSFTYVELLDATNYLNHYYLVCLLGFLLIFLPANRSFSLDTYFNPSLKRDWVPAWCIHVIIFQLALVYTFAGIAKLNGDWLAAAMPLRIWLPEHQQLPIIGSLLKETWVAYAFSFFAAFYDLTIAAWLLWRKSRPIAYVAVVVFHLLTGLFFNIGLFPLIMISSTLIFFSAAFHERLLARLGWKKKKDILSCSTAVKPWLKGLLTVFILLQLALPLRHWLYPGNVLWTEEGYRFSWRVMVVEKIGQAVFHIEDSGSDRVQEIVNGSHLTQFQEKQMCIQPDFILQFANFLKKEYSEKHGFVNPRITVDAHVALNGRISQTLIDPDTNLAGVQDGLRTKKWILPFHN